jgi:hypothetical protein
LRLAAQIVLKAVVEVADAREPVLA